jgi:hypothetical protein
VSGSRRVGRKRIRFFGQEGFIKMGILYFHSRR